MLADLSQEFLRLLVFTHTPIFVIFGSRQVLRLCCAIQPIIIIRAVSHALCNRLPPAVLHLRPCFHFPSPASASTLAAATGRSSQSQRSSRISSYCFQRRTTANSSILRRLATHARVSAISRARPNFICFGNWLRLPSGQHATLNTQRETEFTSKGKRCKSHALHNGAADLLRAHDVAHVQAEVGGLVNKVGPRAVVDNVGARDNPDERATKEGSLRAAEDDGVVVIISGSDFVDAFGGEGRELNIEKGGEPGTMK
jgi:hypothetical protein